MTKQTTPSNTRPSQSEQRKAASPSCKTMSEKSQAFELQGNVTMAFDQRKYQVGQQFVSALLYGDLSALNDQEAERVADFEDDVQLGRRLGHWEVVDEGCSQAFDRCEVTGEFGSVAAMAFVFQVGKALA